MRITVHAECYPTEDFEKVCQALHNIFPFGSISGQEQIVLTTESGERLRELIWDTQIRDSARSVMLRGKKEGFTSFSLNKQAAYAGKISFQDDRPALGCLRVTVEDENIDNVIDYLAESTIED